jgi:hypothetical protein
MEMTASRRQTLRALRAADRHAASASVLARLCVLARDGPGPMLCAFFAAMYYSALRPEEAAMLCKDDLRVPDRIRPVAVGQSRTGHDRD